jgi:hypothetical protein
MSDWFKYYRSSKDHHLRSRPFIWIYWIHCLESAAWKDHTVFWKGKEYLLQRGCFVSTIERDKGRNGLSPSQIRNARKVLKRCRMIDIESSRQGTLIKVNNWNGFQERNGEEPQTIQRKVDTRPTHERHTTDTKTATTEEGKKERKGRKKRITTAAPEYSEAFEKFWKVYPKHEDKAEAFQLYQEIIDQALEDDAEKKLLKFAFAYASEFNRGRKQFAKKAKYILRNAEWWNWMNENKPAPTPEASREEPKPTPTGIATLSAYTMMAKSKCPGIDPKAIRSAFDSGLHIDQLTKNHQPTTHHD